MLKVCISIQNTNAKFIFISKTKLTKAKTYCKRKLMELKLYYRYEPWHEISNNVVCVPSKFSDQPASTPSLIRTFASRLNEYFMRIKLLTEHHLDILSLKGSCTGSSECTLAKIPHCWKSHDVAQMYYVISKSYFFQNRKLDQKARHLLSTPFSQTQLW